MQEQALEDARCQRHSQLAMGSRSPSSWAPLGGRLRASSLCWGAPGARSLSGGRQEGSLAPKWALGAWNSGNLRAMGRHGNLNIDFLSRQLPPVALAFVQHPALGADVGVNIFERPRSGLRAARERPPSSTRCGHPAAVDPPQTFPTLLAYMHTRAYASMCAVTQALTHGRTTVRKYKCTHVLSLASTIVRLCVHIRVRLPREYASMHYAPRLVV